MKIPRTVVAATLIVATIQTTILLQANGVTYDAYNALTHINHIAETGLPLTQEAETWGGATHSLQPLFYYLAAFATILLPTTHAALLIANLATLTIPLLTYLLAREISTQPQAPKIVALLSAFTPLLYAQTTLNATPITLAIPLLLASYYYFLRLGKSPRDQQLFIGYTIALALTHPISLLLVAATTVTLLLQRIQDIKFSKSMAEATLFATFFTTWANLLAHTDVLRTHGLGAIIQPLTPITLATAATNAGLLVVLAATYAASQYLRTETNQSAHALIALATTTLALTLTRIIPTNIGTLILTLALLPLAAGAIETYQQSKHRSRVPGGYAIGGVLLTILFITTSAVPALALGHQQLQNTPTAQEHQLLEELADVPRQKTHWDANKANLLRSHGFPTANTNNQLLATNPQQVQRDLQRLQQVNNPVAYIELLNQQDIQLIILEENHTRPVTERCFERIPTTNYEVYRLTCAVN